MVTRTDLLLHTDKFLVTKRGLILIIFQNLLITLLNILWYFLKVRAMALRCSISQTVFYTLTINLGTSPAVCDTF